MACVRYEPGARSAPKRPCDSSTPAVTCMGLQSVDRQGRGAPCCCCCTMDEETRKETVMPGIGNPEAEIPNCSAIKTARESLVKKTSVDSFPSANHPVCKGSFIHAKGQSCSFFTT